LARSK